MSGNACTIENIIVVMFENRSYDNVLGGLYLTETPPPGQAQLNGLTGDETNPNPNPPPATIKVMNQQTTKDPRTGVTYSSTSIPIYDPGEPFVDMAQQFLGLSSTPETNPYDTISPPLYPPDAQDAMQGFTTNYANQATVPSESVPDIMNYFAPSQMNVTAWLASHFAVCDQWFASAPTQTFTNRAFAHCAAPAVAEGSPGFSLIDDVQYPNELQNPVLTLADLPSIFSQLDAVYPESATSSTPNWKVYFHDYSISMLTVPYVMEKALSPDNVNVATYDNTDWGAGSPPPTPQPITYPLSAPPQQTPLGAVPSTFLEDLSNGTLPKYSFIEPRYASDISTYSNDSSLAPNSNHPGSARYLSVYFSKDQPPIDAYNGETFLHGLFNALYNSDYWSNCLLIVTYDEHGGLYDHVVPPPAPPPGPSIPPVQNDCAAASDCPSAADGFDFNVFGGRVPALIISPFVAPGSAIPPLSSPPSSPPDTMPFDHTSIIKTVWECFDLSQDTSPPITSLTDRDALAPSLRPFLTYSTGNNPGPHPDPPAADAADKQ